jgi:hypothetical protein
LARRVKEWLREREERAERAGARGTEGIGGVCDGVIQ